jgi:hypothetical protein
VTYHARVADKPGQPFERASDDLEPARGTVIATLGGAWVWTALLMAMNWIG